METAVSLYRAAKLQAALDHLGEQLREHPADTKLRTFLFELLCFAGEWTRAEKQLEILADVSISARSGVTLLRELLDAHREREQLFENPVRSATPIEGSPAVRLNGTLFESCEDEDERIGGAVELYSSRGYEVLAWTKVQQLTMTTPAGLRDLLWIPATLHRRGETETERVFLPALAPGSSRHANDEVRLGRLSALEPTDGGAMVPFGTKLLLCDAELISLLDVRTVEVLS